MCFLFKLHTDQTIKLWKVGSRKCYLPQAVNAWKRGHQLMLPQKQRSCLSSPDSDVHVFHSHEKKKYSGAHTYHINSLAINSDNETFLSADDLRINMWNLNNSDTCFSKSN